MITMGGRSRSKTRSSKRKAMSKSRSVTPYRKRVYAPFAKRTNALVSRNVGMGTSATTVLRTSFFVNANAAASGIFTGYLKPGSAFDPTGDLSAIQPQMFDQFAAMYNRYKVNNFTVRVKITGAYAAAASSTYTWVACMYPAVDSTALGTYQAAASQQYAKTTSGGFQSINGGALGVGTEGKYLSISAKHDSVLGARSSTWDVGALVTADPTALQYCVMPLFLQGNAPGLHTWVLEVDIYQNVTFSQKKNTVDA